MTLSIENSDGPIGASISGIDLTAEISKDDFTTVREVIDARAVMVSRDQTDLKSSDLVRFARRFGTPQVNVRAEANNDANPEVFWVSNVHENGKPLGSHDAGRYWHSDLCYLEKPSSVTLLHALEVPTRDGITFGATQFAGASAAYDALPTDMQERIEGLTARNGYRFMWNRKAREFGKRPVLNKTELQKFPEDAIHPIARTHPETGRKCLYVCDGYTHAIEGMEKDKSDSLLAFLFDHIAKPDFRYSHDWQVGDLLI
ncbi:MAG: TauD/TfdA family dioxygenase, partial [Pseudomonadota bacterium]|nr:TauD/TfdA family dioxygenase [Pseudomonadota bacterium]